MVTTYKEYLGKDSVLTFEDMTRLHEAMLQELQGDPEAEALYDRLVRAGTLYVETRAGWKLMAKDVRRERNDERTARHNSVITGLDMLADYLKEKGASTDWRDEIGYEAVDKVNRKRCGDFGCYLAFINAINAR